MGRCPYPKDMCPRCYARGVEFMPLEQRDKEAPFLTYRCPACGHRMTQGKRLRMNPQQRREAERERKKRWRHEHPEHIKELNREYEKAHREERNLQRRLRYRNDEEYRNEKIRLSREYYRNNSERCCAATLKWQREHPGEMYQIRKRAALNALRRKKAGNELPCEP